MAKFGLHAGAEIDLLTPKEFEALTKPLRDSIDALRRAPITMDTAADVSTDGAGNLPETAIYTCPLGRAAAVHRYHVNTAATPIAPVAAGWIGFYRDTANPANRFLFLPASGSAAVAPAVFTDGTDAKVFRNGQRLIVAGAGLPASTVFSFSLQLRLQET